MWWLFGLTNLQETLPIPNAFMWFGAICLIIHVIALIAFLVFFAPSTIPFWIIIYLIYRLFKKLQNSMERDCQEMYKKSKIANGCSYEYYKDNLYVIDLKIQRNLREKELSEKKHS